MNMIFLFVSHTQLGVAVFHQVPNLKEHLISSYTENKKWVLESGYRTLKITNYDKNNS
jgi:hypothetical protein